MLGDHLLVVGVALHRQQRRPGERAPHLALEAEDFLVGEHPPGQQCHHTAPAPLHRLEQGAQLGQVGHPGRHRPTAVAVVGGRGAGGETRRAARHGIGDHRLHERDLVRRGGTFVGVVAHDVEPHGSVTDITPVVECRPPRRHRVEVLGEGLELVPGHAGRQRVEAHVLDVLERPRQERHAVGADGCDGEAAVPRDHRGDPVERGRRQVRVPEHLRVVVGVDVDEAGGHDLAPGIEHTLTFEPLPDVADPSAGDSDVAGPAGGARAVHHGAPPNHDFGGHATIVAAPAARCTRELPACGRSPIPWAGRGPAAQGSR